jgi:hypothetical protein
MFGNLITNRQLKQLIKNNDLQIEPFDEKQLKASHYTLHIGRIFSCNPGSDPVLIHSFKDNKNSPPYELSGNAYVVVEAYEAIKLHNAGIVGRFVTASNLIESGLGLVSGQIGSRYGANGEGVRFGLKNYLPTTFLVDKTFRVAHVEFFDLRGITIDSVKITKEEKRIWLARALRDDDDGVNHDQESD